MTDYERSARRYARKRRKQRGTIWIITGVLLAAAFFWVVKEKVWSGEDGVPWYGEGFSRTKEDDSLTDGKGRYQGDGAGQTGTLYSDGTDRKKDDGSAGVEEPEEAVGASAQAETDYVSNIEVLKVPRPVQRTRAEALERLWELGRENPLIAEIQENSDKYPEALLLALANNPEMANFVAGYGEKGAAGKAALTDKEKEEEFPLFLQWDPRWGYESYGKDNIIGVAGCGPTCMSMALYYLTGDETLTPDKLAAYALEHGYYAQGHGTAWSFMEDVPVQYGLVVRKPSLTEWELQAELDLGSIIICAMREGDFTSGGHFIVIYGYDEEGYKVNDPNCVARSRRHWMLDEIEDQIKSIWAIGKGDEKPRYPDDYEVYFRGQ